MLRFDAYSATTTEAKAVDLVSLFSDAEGSIELRQGPGFHTFGERIAIKSRTHGHEIGSVMWGGRQGSRCMIEVKGESTPGIVEALRRDFPHRCTRVDSCADFDAPKAFERLYRACRAVKKGHGIMGGKMGDWEDFPEKGRTLYLGSTQSPVRTRLYEKGKQPEYLHLDRPNWARLEIQVRPVKQAKEEFSTLTPSQVWGAASWTRDLAASVLADHIDPHPAGTTYRQTTTEHAIAWMCKQYGAHLLDLAHDLGGWAEVGLTLSEIIKEQQADAKRHKSH